MIFSPDFAEIVEGAIDAPDFETQKAEATYVLDPETVTPIIPRERDQYLLRVTDLKSNHVDEHFLRSLLEVVDLMHASSSIFRSKLTLPVLEKFLEGWGGSRKQIAQLPVAGRFEIEKIR